MQTARETRLSLTNSCRNISQTIKSFQESEQNLRKSLQDKYSSMLPKNNKYEDIDHLLDICTHIKEDIITMVDACMAQQPQRRDIINIYMDKGHN